jgi:hypothetical protein
MMIELRELKEVEGGEDAVYLRFSNLPIARSKSFSDGEVNVDLDDYNEVVGIELLSWGPDQIRVLSDIAADYTLRLDRLFFAKK